jgi:hypothetical protein
LARPARLSQSRAIRAHSLTVASAALAGSKSLDDEADYQ